MNKRIKKKVNRKNPVTSLALQEYVTEYLKIKKLPISEFAREALEKELMDKFGKDFKSFKERFQCA